MRYGNMTRRVRRELFMLVFCMCTSFLILAQSSKPPITQSSNSQPVTKPSSQPVDKSSSDLLGKKDTEKKGDRLQNDAVNLARAINGDSLYLETNNQIWVKSRIAKILSTLSKEESIRILEESFLLLHGLEKSLSKHSENQKEKEELKVLERELIALYCKLTPEKGQQEIKKLIDFASKSDNLESSTSKAIDVRNQADRLANLAVSLLQIGNPIGVDVLLKSMLVTGKVSSRFLDAVYASHRNSELQRRLESAISTALKGGRTVDAEDIANLNALLEGSLITQQNTRLTILEFELASLRQIEMIVRTTREQGQPSSIEGESIGYTYWTFNTLLLPKFIKEMPGSEKEVTALLSSLAGSVSGDWAASTRRDLGGMSFEQRLEEASISPSGEQRETLLVDLAMDVLRDKIKEAKLSRRQMLDKVNDKIKSSESKSTLSDYLYITEAKEYTTTGNYIAASGKAQQVSRGDWRGLTLAGIASAVEEKDHDEATRLYVQSLIGLDNCPPSITRIEVAFKVAEMMRIVDPVLSHSLISRSVQYANAIDFTDKKKSRSFPNHYTTIGKISLVLGMEAAQEKDVLRYCNIGELARLDWEGVYLSSLSIENKLLRASFQIKMCEGLLSYAK